MTAVISTAYIEYLQSNGYDYHSEHCLWAREQYKSIAYSDGSEVEARLLSLLTSTEDLCSGSMELASHIDDWQSTYHLSPLRSNLLRPLVPLLHGNILEVGAGCGALTRFLGETGGNVLAVEGTSARARIAAARCKGQDNVTVVADSLHNLPNEPQFDVVTLVGVLEYARQFYPGLSGDPINEMLSDVQNRLRPGGIVIVAIENQLGLKYFAGYPEDHKGIVGYGVQDQYLANDPVTFGRRELSERIRRSGLTHQSWFFPFPDYKTPYLVLTEAGLDDSNFDLSAAIGQAMALDQQSPRDLHFATEGIWAPVLRNQLAGHLANSFLAVGSKEPIVNLITSRDILGYAYATWRKPKFTKETIFKKDIIFRRTLIPQESEPTVSELLLHLESEPFINGKNWRQELVTILNRQGWKLADLEPWFAKWFEALIKSAKLSPPQLLLSSPVPGEFLDAIPRNLIIDADEMYHWFDLEWRLRDSVELGYMVFRAIVTEFVGLDSVADPANSSVVTIGQIYDHLTRFVGMPIDRVTTQRYVDQDNAFHRAVVGYRRDRSPDDIFSRKLKVRRTTGRHEVEQLALQRAVLLEEVHQLKSSTSWRLTAPLRALSRVFMSLFT